MNGNCWPTMLATSPHDAPIAGAAGRRRLVRHPLALVRVGGIAVPPSFSTGETAGLLAWVDALAAQINHETPPLCEALAASLPALHAADRRSARDLLDVKRALFNGRPPKAAAVAALAPLLAERSRAALLRLAALHRVLADATGSIADVHARETETAFTHAVGELARPALHDSIALTNPQLFERLVALRDGTRRISAKDRALLATALARYSWRASRKTSPLASFGRVAVAPWRRDAARDAAAPGTIALSGHRSPVVPRLAVMDSVAAALLRSFDDLAADAPLILNPALTVEEDGSFRWPALVDDELPAARTRRTRTTERRSTAPAVELLARLFATTDRALTVAQVAGALDRIVEGDGERVAALLRHAWSHQVLMLDERGGAPLSRLDGVVAALAPARRSLVEPALARWKATLERPSDGLTVSEAEAALAALLVVAGIDAPAAAFHPLAFADAVTDAPADGIDPAVAAPWIDGCAALLAAMPVLTCESPLSRVRRTLVSAFRARFGDDGACTDVPGFFEAIIAGHPRLFATGAAGSASRAPNSAAAVDDAGVDAVRAQRRSLFRALAALAAAGEPVALTPDAFGALVGPVPAALARRRASHMFFVQPVPSAGTLAVLNQVYPGHGSMLTRFLPNEERWVAPMRDYLAEIVDDEAVEIAGVFGFNANLHPRMTARTVHVPPFTAADAGDRAALSLRDLTLRYAADTDDLCFADAAGGWINPCYLGILTPMLLPPLVQLTRAVGLAGDSMQAFWLQLADAATGEADGSLTLPRISIGGLVVVRRLIAVRADRLPDPHDVDAAFFVAFNRWADARQLPRSLFYQRQRLRALRRDDDGPSRREMNWVRLAKPLPLDRHCTIAVRALQRSLAASDLDLVLAEALPDAGDTVFSHDGTPVTGELGVELSLIGR